MTNPNCKRCKGWGFVPDVVPMRICDEPYNGGVCTPRQAFEPSGTSRKAA